MGKVLLTGASGFIGSHVAELFAQENIPIKCLVRQTSDITLLKQLDVEIVYGDIQNLEDLKKALIDVDFIIHTAGKSSDWGSYVDFYQNNVLGTMNILKASQIGNIKHLIITGSVSSYGEEHNLNVKDENSPSNSHYHYFLDRIFPSSMNYYRDTKAMLTQEACAFANENGLNLTVLEPAWVYGEREFNSGFYEYVKAVKNGMRYAPGCKHNLFHVIYAPDLAQAYLKAYQLKMSGVNRLIIGNPHAEKLYEIHTLFCKSAQLKMPKLLPKIIVYPMAFFMEFFASLHSSKIPPLLTRSRVNMMYDHIAFSAEKSHRILGFKANTPLTEGVLKTVSWYQQNGYL